MEQKQIYIKSIRERFILEPALKELDQFIYEFRQYKDVPEESIRAYIAESDEGKELVMNWYTARQQEIGWHYQKARGIQKQNGITAFEKAIYEDKTGLPEPPGQLREPHHCAVCTLPVHAEDRRFGAGIQTLAFVNPTDGSRKQLTYVFHHHSCVNRMRSAIKFYQEEALTAWEKVQELKKTLNFQK